ncbi:Sir2 family NAD-dependent protein deacetylase [Pelomonas sp. KK5]|uniref:SIR2 family NAD-dependent protein deacylase n=1 Tax=Pelomonas sp. KK5 TaxID=1855730 RepID=UPI001E61566D|nr:Sir2 family NAD-dependent protein deacetylase [Pelomonas sp. KK5]
MINRDPLQHAAELIEQADALIIAAGAGMGVDSGLPDFRGTTGFWQAYPALAAARLEFTAVASPQTFAEDPGLAWGFYGHRLGLYRNTTPHAGFGLLRQWAERVPLGGFVYTSNVDGQFQKAGFDEQALVVECHGSLHWLQCTRPCSSALFPADGLDTDVVDDAACRWRGPLPRCPRCDALARPNVLMFGDGSWVPDRSEGQALRLSRWIASARRPVVIEIGAGTAVPSVRHFSQRVIHAHGGRLIRINPREPQVPTSADVGLALGALEGLRALDGALQALR